MKILVVEDDPKINAFITRGFEEAGFSVDGAEDGEDGLHLALEGSYEAAVVDIMLPQLDGLSLIERMRSSGIKTPVIILSARKSVDDRISGLQKGGDDYLVKPFAFSELLARVNALIRRSRTQPTDNKLRFADLEVDLAQHSVTRGQQRIDLNPKEFSLLCYLIKNGGRIVSKTGILENVYNYNFDPQTNVVDVLVFRLRNKIDKEFETKLLHTVRGMGYILDDGQNRRNA